MFNASSMISVSENLFSCGLQHDYLNSITTITRARTFNPIVTHCRSVLSKANWPRHHSYRNCEAFGPWLLITSLYRRRGSRAFCRREPSKPTSGKRSVRSPLSTVFLRTTLWALSYDKYAHKQRYFLTTFFPFNPVLNTSYESLSTYPHPPQPKLESGLATRAYALMSTPCFYIPTCLAIHHDAHETTRDVTNVSVN